MSMRLCIIDDHPLFLDGMTAALCRLEEGIEVIPAADAEQGLAVAAREALDMVLIDLKLPGIDGITAIGEFHRRFPSLPIVVLSAMEREEDMRRAIHAGALGYIPKASSMNELLHAIRQVQEGKVYLPTPMMTQFGGENRRIVNADSIDADKLSFRQMEVLVRLCEGLTNRQIATDLDLSEKTVKSHVTTIFRALGVVNRTQAVLAAKKLGISVA